MALISGSDNYYSNFNDAFRGNMRKIWGGLAGYAMVKTLGSNIGRMMYWSEQNKYAKDREIQGKEFNALKDKVKTVNYGSAITNPSDPSGELTTEEQQAAANLALQEEEELLGKRMSTLGSASLLGVLR